MKTRETPAQAGYRMPAEWDEHEATWIAWPHTGIDWPGKLHAIEWVYAEFIRGLLRSEPVVLLLHSKRIEERARTVLRCAGLDQGDLRYYRVPLNRGWARDFGPIFVRRLARPRDVAIVDFRFNGWARVDNWQRDDAVSRHAANTLGLRRFNPLVEKRRFVLEGGAIDTNGEGVLLTTEECLLDQEVQTRNPGLSRAAVEQVLCDYLGMEKILWLGRGVAGDDTHGHVDDLCRFVRRDTVVHALETRSDDVNYAALQENRERLQGLRLPGGARLKAIPLPMPDPLHFAGRRLPASYANFYIGNQVVLVPTFNDPADRKALGILAELFPDKRVMGIHAVDLVWGRGTLHCLTQQQPKAG